MQRNLKKGLQVLGLGASLTFISTAGYTEPAAPSLTEEEQLASKLFADALKFIVARGNKVIFLPKDLKNNICPHFNAIVATLKQKGLFDKVPKPLQGLATCNGISVLALNPTFILKQLPVFPDVKTLNFRDYGLNDNHMNWWIKSASQKFPGLQQLYLDKKSLSTGGLERIFKALSAFETFQTVFVRSDEFKNKSNQPVKIIFN